MKADALLAFFVFAVSTVVVGSAYRALLEVERPQQAMLRSLPSGPSLFAVTDGNGCVGKFSSELKFVPETTIVSHGELRFRYGSLNLSTITFAGVYFNALDQMVKCNLVFETPGVRVEVSLTNPNPINVLVTANIHGRHLTRELSIPGPVLLRRNQDGTYRIDYSSINAGLAGYGNALNQFPVDSLKLDIEPGPACASTEGKIVLDPIVAQLQSFMKSNQLGNYLGVLN